MVEEPTAWAVHAEHLYHNFCESIVCYIEQASEIESPSEDDADTWVCGRAPFIELIDFVTLERFTASMNGPAPHRLISCIEETAELRQSYIELLGHLRTRSQDDYEDPRADEATYARLSGWHRRVRESRERLLENLESRRSPVRASGVYRFIDGREIGRPAPGLEN